MVEECNAGGPSARASIDAIVSLSALIQTTPYTQKKSSKRASASAQASDTLSRGILQDWEVGGGKFPVHVFLSALRPSLSSQLSRSFAVVFLSGREVPIPVKRAEREGMVSAS